MTVRVYKNEKDFKYLQVKRTDLFGELELKVLEEFKIDAEPKNVRLRGYNPAFKIMIESYAETCKGEQLQNLGILNYKNFMIETKTDDQEF